MDVDPFGDAERLGAASTTRAQCARPVCVIEQQKRVMALRDLDQLAGRGIETAPSTTHIVPVVLGANERTMAICETLLERGFYAQGIRHPSVPGGTARLRLTVMATHTDDEIDALAEAVAGASRAHP